MKSDISRLLMLVLIGGVIKITYDAFFINKVSIPVMNTSYLMSGISISKRVMLRAEMHYDFESKLASSNKELGIQEPEKYMNKALKRLDIDKNGNLLLTYNRKSGIDNGVIKFVPVVEGNRVSKWDCYTHSYANIEKALPMCRYLAPN